MDTEERLDIVFLEQSSGVFAASCVATIDDSEVARTSLTAFATDELADCVARPSPPLSIAARLAAKRAVQRIARALLVGSADWPTLRDVHIATLESGAPVLRFSEALERALRRRGVVAAHVSLTHVRRHGAAFVAMETR